MAEWIRPGNTDNISDHYADHQRRGSLGGTDWTDGYGTPMRAMKSGVVVMVDSNPDGSGGRMITIRTDDGHSYEELHADRFVVSRGQRVSQGQVLGYSGGSGYGKNNYYGAHIHAHGVYSNGVRFDLEPLVYRSGTAGGGITIIMSWNTPLPVRPDNWYEPAGNPNNKPEAWVWLVDVAQRVENLYNMLRKGERVGELKGLIKVLQSGEWNTGAWFHKFEQKDATGKGDGIAIDAKEHIKLLGSRALQIKGDTASILAAVKSLVDSYGEPTKVTVEISRDDLVSALLDDRVREQNRADFAEVLGRLNLSASVDQS